MKIIVIGAGGHARVVYEILRHYRDKNVEVFSFIDNVANTTDEKIMGIPVTGDHSVLPCLIKDNKINGYIVAVGDNNIRSRYFDDLMHLGLDPINAIHPKAHIAYQAVIEKGVVISTGSTISTKAKIGNNSIINTGAIIEHESIIGDNVHIAPGTVVAGRVEVKDGAFVGAGSVVKEYIHIGKNSVIGAGSVVLDDIPDNVTAVGVPAKIIKKNSV